jgi:hypothetical protein
MTYCKRLSSLSRFGVDASSVNTKAAEGTATGEASGGLPSNFWESIGNNLPDIINAIFGKKEAQNISPATGAPQKESSNTIWWVALGLGGAVLIGGTILALRRPAPKSIV